MTNATTYTPTDDLAAIAKEKLVSASVSGGDSSSAGRSHPISGGISDRTGGDFLEKRRLKSVVEEKDSLLKSRCDEIESLKAHLLINEAEAAEAVRLYDEAHALKERNTYLEKEKIELEIKVTDLATSVKVREQEVTDLDAVVTSVKLQNDSLADQVHKLEVASFGFQEKLSYYENLIERLDEFQDAQLKVTNDKLEKLSNKDASVDTIMNILHLEDNLTKRLGLTELQPCVDQLMVPIHHSLDRVVIGATSLSFVLDVSNARVRKIKENITSQRPALRDVFTPISEPFFAEVLTGTRGTSDTVPAPITMALSVTSISASAIPPISTDDYEIAHTEGREDDVANVEAVVDEGADPFPNVRACPRLPHGLLSCSGRQTCSLFTSKKFKLIPKDSLFLTISTSVVLKVGMPISAGITAFAPYVNENGVSYYLT
nr:hypothetical protein [Tanacetum cinerariifolium]